MIWGAAFYFNSILLGVGLAMDAFSVSIANGLLEPDMRRGRRSMMAGTFAFFQWLMPVVGWFCVHALASRFALFQKAVPWIALLLLLYIGGKMLIESILHLRRKHEARKAEAPVPVRETARITAATLLLQGIATSIDALSVGFAISGYGWLQALICAVIIAVVTYCICMIGLQIGRKASEKLSDKAGILGGCILIFIGIEIFVRGVL